jgi:hypothetical protein
VSERREHRPVQVLPRFVFGLGHNHDLAHALNAVNTNSVDPRPRDLVEGHSVMARSGLPGCDSIPGSPGRQFLQDAACRLRRLFSIANLTWPDHVFRLVVGQPAVAVSCSGGGFVAFEAIFVAT